MNILPKKSWHVRSHKNIERVKRDEAQAAEEIRERQERAALAEQEARTTLLRSKARQLTSTPHVDERLAVQSTDDSAIITKHIDLFSELAADKPMGEKNKEHEKDEKAAKEKYERSIGLLTYLGQSSTEAQTAKPWYFKPPDRDTSRDSREQSCTDMKRKTSLDPMLEMEKYLGVKRPKGITIKPAITSVVKNKKHVQHSKLLSCSNIPGRRSTDVRNPSPEVKRRNQQNHTSKHKHKDKHKSRRDKGGRKKRRKGLHHHDVSDSKRKHSHGGDVEVTRRDEKDEGPSIQQLRAERIKREAAERLKTNRLLSGQKLNEEDSKVSEEMTDRPGQYNSQFHPELVRNKRKSFHFSNV